MRHMPHHAFLESEISHLILHKTQSGQSLVQIRSRPRRHKLGHFFGNQIFKIFRDSKKRGDQIGDLSPVAVVAHLDVSLRAEPFGLELLIWSELRIDHLPTPFTQRVRHIDDYRFYLCIELLNGKIMVGVGQQSMGDFFDGEIPLQIHPIDKMLVKKRVCPCARIGVFYDVTWTDVFKKINDRQISVEEPILQSLFSLQQLAPRVHLIDPHPIAQHLNFMHIQRLKRRIKSNFKLSNRLDPCLGEDLCRHMEVFRFFREAVLAIEQ